MACQEGMCSEKPGTARGSPRRSRTAKASRISRCAVKSRCACEWGGWGRLSDDGPGQNNPDPSEGPWGGGLVVNLQEVVHSVPTGNAEVAKPPAIRGETEWTRTRMPLSPRKV